MATQKLSLAKRVWSHFAPMNVNEDTKKKQNLTYLSWSKCWELLATDYPDSHFAMSHEAYPDGSVMTFCELTVAEGDESFTRTMYLPVMDHRNQPIFQPNAVQINKAYQRTLAKAVSVATGLGLYIYNGEDIPSAEADAEASTPAKESNAPVKAVPKKAATKSADPNLEALTAELLAINTSDALADFWLNKLNAEQRKALAALKDQRKATLEGVAA